MCYWQNNSKSIALSVWDTTPADKIGYGEAVRWNGLRGIWVCGYFSIAFYLAKLQKHGAKMVHFDAFYWELLLFILPCNTKSIFIFVVIIGYGIAWASMMGSLI
jgi:maltose/moltooligosaccharide transporter